MPNKATMRSIGMEGLSSAVGFAAKLKPEIRLAQAISEFNASLRSQNQRTRFKNLQSQSPPGSDDIIRLTEEINRDGARAHRSWRPYGTRLVAILDRIRQFAPIGDVLVGGSQNLIACGVWAVVRLSLEASLSFLSYFENVTSMMLRLGRSLSLHKDFAMLFPRCSTLQSYMCEYTIVMVNICAKILHNCAKSTLSQLTTSLTSTFDAVFKPLESDLATWALLIEKRATVLLAKADLQSQSSVLDQFNRLQVTISRESANREKSARKHKLFASLFPDQGEFNLIWRRERRKGTSTWMYEQDAYETWLSSATWSVLWLKGNLGSGKTVAMASVAAHLISAAAAMEPKGAVTVSYFFCQSINPKTLSATTLLGSIVGQALQNPTLEPSLMSFLAQQEIVHDSRTGLEDSIGILLKATPLNWRGIFVLDGLDEMPEEEVDDIFVQLKRLRDHRRVHLLCSSRPTSTCYSIAKSHMNVGWTLSMETADRSDEIRAYITAEISRWNRIRPLPTALERLVEEQLLVGCQGMFLWLSLQIEDICPRYTQELRSDAEILDILGNLPKDLPGAFDKALSRIRDTKYGSKLFSLVASAEPPLKMDELRVALNVEPGNTHWNSSTLIGSGKALISMYGGSLLDIDEEDLRVRFIHYSVLLHLTTTSSGPGIFHFDLLEAEGMLGAVCVTYLNYSVFENRISTAQKVSFGQVPQTTASSVLPSDASRKAFSLLAKHRPKREAKIDFERLSYELQNQRWRVRDDVHLFLDFAQDQWLSATRKIWSNDRHAILPLWRKLIINPIVSASLPWGSVSEAVTWALSNGHETLFQHYLHSDDQDHFQLALSAVVGAVSTGESSIHVRGKGLGWLGPLYLVHPHYQASILQAFIKLGCQPFTPTLAQSPNSRLTGLALTASADSHIVPALRSYSGDREMKGYILFLANYLNDPDLVLDDRSTLLHLALRCGCESLATELLSKGANPDGGRAKGHPTPLQICARKKFLGLAKHLIELGADINVTLDDGTPLLFLAIDNLDWELFSALLVRGAFFPDRRYGRDNETACHRICAAGVDVKSKFSETALEALIKRNADLNARNRHKKTPLMLAAKTNKPWVTEILLANGADPNIGDKIGARPLHYAQTTEIIHCLLSSGADPNTATTEGHITPLMVAARQGQADSVAALLDAGADPSLCISGDLRGAEVSLLERRIVTFTKAKPGWTAFHLCSLRLEMELRWLSPEDYRENDPDHSAGLQLCSELVSIIIQLLKRGDGSQPRYSELFDRLGEVLSKGAEGDAALLAELDSALEHVTAEWDTR